MFWAFEVLCSLFFGYELVTFLIPTAINPIMRFFAGVPIGFLCFAWICFIISYKRILTFEIGLTACAIQTIASLLLLRFRRKKKVLMTVSLTLFEASILIFFSIFYVILMHYSMLHNGTDSRGSGYGDLPFHMNIFSAFSHGCNRKRDSFFLVDTVFYEGEKLAYPYMTNYLTAVYMATGRATMRAALLFPSSLIAISLVVGQFYLGKLFTDDSFSILIAMFMFLNLGGLGWTRLFDPTFQDGDLIYMWGNDIQEYWFHPIMHVLVPQRASLWSMPLCYWCLICLIIGIKFMKWKFFLLASLYVGITPLVQVHSYVSLAQWSIVYAAINFPWKDKSKWSIHILCWAIYGIVANVLAVPQFTPFLQRLRGNVIHDWDGTTHRDKFISLNPIWNESYREQTWYTPFRMWWRGLAVFAVVTIVVGWVALSKKQVMMYIPSMVVWLVSNFIRYQPWEMDNTKMFYAAWIPIAIFVFGVYMARILRNKYTMIIGLILIAAASASAIRHTYRTLPDKTTIFKQHDLDFGNWVSENTPLHAIFMASYWHGHPSFTIAGRQAYAGYGGWLLSHGLDYFLRYDHLKRMEDEPFNPRFFAEDNITYVVNMNHEFKQWNNITNQGMWTKIYDDDNYQLWKIKNSLYF